MLRNTALGTWLLLAALGCGSQEPSAPAAPGTETAEAPREPCADRNPLRNPYFGDLHVHTALSMDAYSFEVRTTPDDAYRFARGEELELTGDRRAQLSRPLDFAAVTDHASYLGEGSLCTRAGSPVYESERCAAFRGEDVDPNHPLGEMGARVGAITQEGLTVPRRSTELCGDDLELCRSAMGSVWEELRASAERFNDRSSACRFTTFNGYEYTAQPEFTKVHRNVVFRNAVVPNRPVAWVDEPNVWGLWEKLRDQCLDLGDGCDVLTIPHNSNMSNGRMWVVDYRSEPREQQVARARLRARVEPLVEIMQTKGDSECRNGLWKVVGDPDEQCEFEKWRPLDPAPEDCRDATGERGSGGSRMHLASGLCALRVGRRSARSGADRRQPL